MADTALHGMQQGCRLVLALYALEQSGEPARTASVMPLTQLRSRRQVATQLNALAHLGFAWRETQSLRVRDRKGQVFGGTEHRFGLTAAGRALVRALLREV